MNAIGALANSISDGSALGVLLCYSKVLRIFSGLNVVLNVVFYLLDSISTPRESTSRADD